MSVRTNYCPNPRYIGADMVSGGTGGAVTQEDLPSGAPDGRGYTSITLSANQTSNIFVGNDLFDASELVVGQTYTTSVHLLSPRSGGIDVRLVWVDSGGGQVGQELENNTIVADEWKRIDVSGVMPSGATQYRIVGTLQNSLGLLASDTVGIAQRALVDGPEAGAYYDGGTSNTSTVVHAWTGLENASTSTETTAEISAALLTTDQPQPVQVLVSDVPAGESYLVQGVTGSGRTWGIPGGAGVADGGQVRLVDNRSPHNAPVSYRVTIGQEVLTSNQVTVSWVPPDGDSPRFLIQSLDGSILVPVRQWWDNGLPKTPEVRSTRFPIRGRRRPVVVLQPAAEGDSPVQVLLSREAGERLDEIMARGGAVCVRTTGNERDLPPSDLAVVMAGQSSLFPNDGVSTSRLWDLTLTWIDDPEPSTVPTVFTWDEVDELLGTTLGLTWDEVDAMFAGLTWDDVDATDWGSIS